MAGGGVGGALAAPSGDAPSAKAFSTSTIGEILDNPAAKAVVDRRLPKVFANPQIKMARPLTLKALQRFAKDGVSDAALVAIDKDFAALAKK
ncbi:hypothetical protein EV278_106116 [Caulobacter sp. BK020]|nr:hypothetical protein EV278_106116 [Caulobacter sp. BK020]